jgi:hypothetical protein
MVPQAPQLLLLEVRSMQPDCGQKGWPDVQVGAGLTVAVA